MSVSIQIYANLAQNILAENSRYIHNKKVIDRVFNLHVKSKVQLRLTVIDSYYSTQMSKRLYGLEDISISLNKYNDPKLQYLARRFLENTNEGEIYHLFQERYGLNKKGEENKKAISLISKYLYFLMKGNFPIYDDLGKNSFKFFKKNGYIDASSINKSNYFERMIELNRDSGLNDFEKLDNLLWLTGKLLRGSFSILMNKEKYEKLTADLNFPKKCKSKEVDNIIRDYIKKNFKNSSIFSNDEKLFMEFVFSMKEGIQFG